MSDDPNLPTANTTEEPAKPARRWRLSSLIALPVIIILCLTATWLGSDSIARHILARIAAGQGLLVQEQTQVSLSLFQSRLHIADAAFHTIEHTEQTPVRWDNLLADYTLSSLWSGSERVVDALHISNVVVDWDGLQLARQQARSQQNADTEPTTPTPPPSPEADDSWPERLAYWHKNWRVWVDRVQTAWDWIGPDLDEPSSQQNPEPEPDPNWPDARVYRPSTAPADRPRWIIQNVHLEQPLQKPEQSLGLNSMTLVGQQITHRLLPNEAMLLSLTGNSTILGSIQIHISQTPTTTTLSTEKLTLDQQQLSHAQLLGDLVSNWGLAGEFTASATAEIQSDNTFQAKLSIIATNCSLKPHSQAPQTIHRLAQACPPETPRSFAWIITFGGTVTDPHIIDTGLATIFTQLAEQAASKAVDDLKQKGLEELQKEVPDSYKSLIPKLESDQNKETDPTNTNDDRAKTKINNLLRGLGK